MKIKRTLSDLCGVGPAALQDLDQLGVGSVEQLASQDPQELFDRLCQKTGVQQDPCVRDVLTCAVAQARNPRLPKVQRNWWYWSRKRKKEKHSQVG